jgi:membrane fusion protein
MNSPLFRSEVIEANRGRLVGTVFAATPPGSPVYVALVAAVALACAGVLLLGSYATRAPVRGVVAYDRGLARVYSNDSGEVRAVHVREGASVQAGMPLVTVALAQGAGGVAEQIEQLDRRDRELARQQDLAARRAEAEQRGFAGQRTGLAATLLSLERQRELAARQVELAETARRRAVELEAEGAGTQRQIEAAVRDLLSRRTEVESLAERIIAQQQQLRTVEAAAAQARVELTTTDSQLEAQRAAIAEQRAALTRTDSLVLTAPVSGEVVDVATQPGRRATPDSALISVVPTGSRLEVWLYAPSRAVGFVRPGQDVRLMFDAFPHQRYGVGSGRVIDASRVPVEPTSVSAPQSDSEPVFRVRVSLDGLPRRGAETLSVRPGMTLSANLILQRQSLWRALFDPVAAALRT